MEDYVKELNLLKKYMKYFIGEKSYKINEASEEKLTNMNQTGPGYRSSKRVIEPLDFEGWKKDTQNN